MSWRSWSVRACGSQVGMSPMGSYVCGLTSKGQVGVLLWEHRGWMLHMAFSYKTKILHTSARFPMLEHTAFYFPPFTSKDLAVNSMEIKDFLRLWTYSQWRQAIVIIPPLSREGNMWYPSAFLYSNKVESTIHRLRRSPFLSRKEHRFSCFPFLSFLILTFS